MTAPLMLSVLLLPLIGGGLILLLPFKTRRSLLCLAAAVLSAQALLVTLLCCQSAAEMTLFAMTDQLVIALKMDDVSRVFMLIAAWGFLLAGLFAFRYMVRSTGEAFPEKNFYAFFLFTLAALTGMDLSENVITMYLFFEMVTLLSMPLVLHERSRESIAAALKYLFYSIAGAFLALGSIFVLAGYAESLSFTPGGWLGRAALAGTDQGFLRTMIFLGIVGFGAKAGMYPLHGWLPSAHPVAPAPASAVLSAVITKAGVLAILRMLYYVIGPDYLRGSWMQTALLILSLITVFMGSMMAYREKILKKRLAYSSVSQISYALFGLFLMTPEGLQGGLLQVIFHAIVKICLFLAAGAVICHTGRTDVTEMKGLGRQLPLTFGAFTMAALSLIGIPPFAGFVSKWVLAEASLGSGLPVISWLGPVILLVSALLTAGYLLPVSINAFFPGRDFAETAPEPAPYRTAREGGLLMLVPLLVLAALSLLLGVFSGAVVPFVNGIAALLG